MLPQVERAAHCSDVRPGKARVFTCLLAHIESEDYRQGCRDQLSAQQARRVSDWRLDYDLRQACKDDVPKVGCPLPACRPGSSSTCCMALQSFEGQPADWAITVIEIMRQKLD